MGALMTDTGLAAVLDLDDARASRADLGGSKAASLAVARQHGIAVIPGFVVTTSAHGDFLAGAHAFPPHVLTPLRRAWEALSDNGSVPLVVRSSSTVEDVGSSSMAGRFRSLLDVRGWEAFLDAVANVLGSADEVGGDAGPAPMGVLVQRYLPADRGGVMFGVDPVTGDPRHMIVEAVAGGPDALVSGRVDAEHYVVSRRGRRLSVDHSPGGRGGTASRSSLLGRRELRELARLALRAEAAFSGPQDVEWALDSGGHLLLLQSRPVTATGVLTQGEGPVLGPGPMAETFPDPLSRLEVDLWVESLRQGVVAALTETRAVAHHHLERSPVVTTVRGRVAADLELFGYVRRRRASMIDPRPPLRRLAAGWHVGTLRAVLPERAAALVREVDAELSAVSLGECSDEQLLGVLDRTVALLTRLHHAEVLAGTILPKAERSGAAAALATLERARRLRVPEFDLVRRYPELLNLYPPGIGTPVLLPGVPPAGPEQATPDGASPASPDDLAVREQLRTRARWAQELGARAAWELGRRLTRRGVVDEPATVALVDRAGLRALVAGDGSADQLRAEVAHELDAAFAPPLPAEFRLTAAGDVVPAARQGCRPGRGTGAGGGRGAGPVVHGSPRHPPAPGDVLVVRELQPGLAGSLPGLAGLVAETGGTLSHLAILAREYGVPTVVAVHDALQRFPVGARLLVDGATGELTLLGTEETS